jgi:hypothetical protein
MALSSPRVRARAVRKRKHLEAAKSVREDVKNVPGPVQSRVNRNAQQTATNSRRCELSRTARPLPRSGSLPKLRGSQGESRVLRQNSDLNQCKRARHRSLKTTVELIGVLPKRKVEEEDKRWTCERTCTKTRGQREENQPTCASPATGPKPPDTRLRQSTLLRQQYSNGPNPRPELTHHYFLPALIPHKCYNIALEHKNNKSHYRFLYPFSQRRHLSLGHTQVCWITSNRHCRKII